MSRDGKLRRPTLPGLGAEQQRHVYYYALLPNLLLSLHPDYVMSHTLWPREPATAPRSGASGTSTRASSSNPAFDPADAIDFWDDTNREDWHVSELSQLGISSRGYAPGPYSPREGLLWEFDRIVVRAASERDLTVHVGPGFSPASQVAD